MIQEFNLNEEIPLTENNIDFPKGLEDSQLNKSSAWDALQEVMNSARQKAQDAKEEIEREHEKEEIEKKEKYAKKMAIFVENAKKIKEAAD